MSDEIADFLRRAAERYAAQTGRPEILNAEIVEDAEILDPGDGPGDELPRRVGHLEASSLGRRPVPFSLHEHAGEVPLHQPGEPGHGPLSTLSSLDEPAAVTSDYQLPAGLDFVALLQDPQQMRHAIVMSEVLRRPEHLW